MQPLLNRRSFVQQSALITAAMAMGRPCTAASSDSATANPICIFIKPLQSLSYDQLAEGIARLGCSGIEATVRNGGYIAPEAAARELPLLVQALDKQDLKVTILTSDVVRADQPNAETLLRVASDLGIAHYRMGFHRYDLRGSVLAQLEALKEVFANLADLNRRLGIQGLLQNHSGGDYVGGTVWDGYHLVKEIDPSEINLAFDIRHATIEAGLSWPVLYNAVRERIGAVFVKDFNWDGKRTKHVPLGTGRVEQRFFDMLRSDHYEGPISLHIEYLLDKGPETNLAAFKDDLTTLHGWLTPK